MTTQYAEVINGIVVREIVIEPEMLATGAWGDPTNWVKSLDAEAKPTKKNRAGIGYTYDKTRDTFIPPKPFNSWQLDEQTAQWTAPKERPKDGKHYRWDESKADWVRQ